MECLESIAFLHKLLNYYIHPADLSQSSYYAIQLNLFVNNNEIFIFNLKSDRFLELDFRKCETVFLYS